MKPNLNNITLTISAGNLDQFPEDNLLQVAFSGRSNVGKSSLINSLLERKALAKVSSNPGRTVTVNFFNVDDKLYLVDLPGYGYAKRGGASKKKWSSITDGYFTRNPGLERIRTVIQLIDLKVGPTKDDRAMIQFMNTMNIPYIIVATKVDKLKRNDYQKNLSKLKNDKDLKEGTLVIPYSSKLNKGRMELRTEIFKRCDLID